MPNTSEDVIFRRGPSASIPQEKVPGTILIETDTGNMYVDDTESSRIQIGDSRKMDKWGDIQDLGSGAPLVIKPQDQSTLGTPTTSFGISLNGIPNDGLYLTSTGHGIHFEGNYLFVSNSEVALVSEGDSGQTHLSVSNSGVSLDNNLSVEGIVDCNTLSISATSEHGINLTEISSGLLSISSSGGSVVVRGVSTPVQSTDAANKQYVDGLYQNLESEIVTTAAQYLPLKGGTMTGSIDMGDYLITSLGTPQSDNDAANKAYVDSELGDYLPLSGGTMSGDINFGASAVTVYGKGVMTKDSSYNITNSSGRATLSISGDTVLLGNSNGSTVLQGTGISLDGAAAINFSAPQFKVSASQTDLTASSGVFNFHCTDSESTRVILNFDTTAAGGALLRGVADPLNSDDAANKQYVDSKFASAGGGDFMADGSVPMSGNLRMSGGKQIQFLDGAGTNFAHMSTSGTNTSTVWTFSTIGTIRFSPPGLSISISTNGIDMGSMGSRKITNLIAPTAATDAANKAYVDSQVADISIDDGSLS